MGVVTLDLIASSTSTGKAFMMGYTVDDDSGGMLGDIYPTSIRLALEEKIAKTKDIADKFDRWILILVDDVLPGIMEPNDIGPLDLDLQHSTSLRSSIRMQAWRWNILPASSNFTRESVSAHTSFTRNEAGDKVMIWMTGSKRKVSLVHSLHTRLLFHNELYLRREGGPLFAHCA